MLIGPPPRVRGAPRVRRARVRVAAADATDVREEPGDEVAAALLETLRRARDDAARLGGRLALGGARGRERRERREREDARERDGALGDVRQPRETRDDGRDRDGGRDRDRRRGLLLLLLRGRTTRRIRRGVQVALALVVFVVVFLLLSVRVPAATAAARARARRPRRRPPRRDAHVVLKIPSHARDAFPRVVQAVHPLQRGVELSAQHALARSALARPHERQHHHRPAAVSLPHLARVRRRGVVQRVQVGPRHDLRSRRERGRLLRPEERDASAELRRGGERRERAERARARARARFVWAISLRRALAKDVVPRVDDLLRLHLVRDVAALVHAASVVSRPREVPRPTRDQRHRHRTTEQRQPALLEVPVDDRGQPLPRGGVA
eukprot:30893-Pelagococcus_subviridis.AAC.2